MESDDKEEEETQQRQLLSYLPNHGQNIPPQLRQLVLQATRQYMNGGVGSAAAPAPAAAVAGGTTTESPISNTTTTATATTTTLQDISEILKLEHRSRDVPVQLMAKNGASVRVDVTQTGEELDEICAELLSAAALYELPAEITLQLLSSPVRERALHHHNNHNNHHNHTNSSPSSVIGDSSLVACQAVFAETGWSQVYFPNGLAVRPHRRFLSKQKRNNNSNNDKKSWMTTNFGWRKSVREARAIQAVQAAAQAMPPPRPQFQNRDEFLQLVQAQFDAEQNAAAVGTAAATSAGNLFEAALTFFPQQQQKQTPGMYQIVTRRLAHPWRTLQRLGRKQYTALRKQGRAGVLSYCFFNFLYYTLGMMWQWPRIPAVPVAAAALHNNNVSATALLWRKAATVYAYLYAASQLVKLPKLIASVALAPWASQCLLFCRRRSPSQWVRNDNQAMALLIAVLMLMWLILVAGLLSNDYAQILQQLAAVRSGAGAGGLLPRPQPPQPHFYLDRLVQMYGKVQPV